MPCGKLPPDRLKRITAGEFDQVNGSGSGTTAGTVRLDCRYIFTGGAVTLSGCRWQGQGVDRNHWPG